LSPQEACAENAADIAAEPLPFFIGQERTVAVAIGGKDRIKLMLGSPFAGELHIFGADGLGIDRNKFFGAAQENDFGPRRRVTTARISLTDGRMLVNADLKPGKRIGFEEIQETLLIFARSRIIRRLRLAGWQKLPSSSKSDSSTSSSG
jgi:hypothetical protein